jgi:proline iminopeptidase
MLAPYPDIKINRSDHLSVSDLHTLYIEESGSAEGYPALVLHDGPGSGSEAYHRRLFDAERFRIIQFDQRGCGRSCPFAETEQNSLVHSVADADAVLQHLDIAKAVLVGFGWGARIAMEFAKVHPEKVISLVLCGYGYESRAATNWLFEGGARDLFPDEWAILTEALEVTDSDPVLSRLLERMADTNEFVQIQTAKAWAYWLARISSFHVHRSVVERLTHPHNALALAKLGSQVFQKLAVTKGVEELSSIVESGLGGFIVHGRYDAVCPLAHGYSLHQRWPHSELLIVRDAGHSIHDPAMTDTMIRAIGKIADVLDGVEKLNG